MQAQIKIVPSFTPYDPQYCCGVQLKVGVQSFRLAYDGTYDECVWYANQLRHALNNVTNFHDIDTVDHENPSARFG